MHDSLRMYALLVSLSLLITIPNALGTTLEWDIQPQRDFSAEIQALRPDRLKILWWNIKYGDHSRKMEKITGRKLGPLDYNLRYLIQNPKLKPQILALGEYKERALKPQTLAMLKSAYPYQYYFPMNERHPEVGEMVFSEFPAEFTQQTQLAWYPKENPVAYIQSWAKPYPVHVEYFERNLNRFQFFFRGFTFELFPLHLNQPWFGYTFGDSATKGILPSLIKGSEIIWGKNSPLWYQVNAMRAELARILGRAFHQNHYLILLGDLNLPESAAGFSPELYERAKGFLKDPLAGKGQFSFPAASTDFKFSKFNNKFRIDHAFISKPITSDFAEVLTITGSDHYPVYISVFP